MIDKLIDRAIYGGDPPGEVRRWLQQIDDRLHDQLQNAGLVRTRQGHTVKTLTEACIQAKQGSVRTRTITSLKQGAESLLRFFGPDRDISTITEGDADDFQSFLLSPRTVNRKRGKAEPIEVVVPGLSKATTNRRIRHAKTFFRYAERKKFIQKSPFASIVAGGSSNGANKFYVSPELANRVLESLPTASWRLLFSLYRWGGLRFMEPKYLTWESVVEDQGIICVFDEKRSKKGRPVVRRVPIDPRVERYLLEVWEQLPEGTPSDTPIFPDFRRLKNPNPIFRKQLQACLKRAGIAEWPRLFHNLRGSAESDMMKTDPVHVVCEIIGNTPRVAHEHYLSVTEDDYTALRESMIRRASQDDQQRETTEKSHPRKFSRTVSRRRQEGVKSTTEHDTNKKPRETKPGVSVDVGNCGRPDGRKTLSSRPGRT